MKKMLLMTVLFLLSYANVFCISSGGLQWKRCIDGGNLDLCRTVGCAEEKDMSLGGKLVPTLSIRLDSDMRYRYVVDSNLDQWTRAKYEAKIRQAEAMMREGDASLLSNIRGLLAQVPVFYQRQSSGNITFFARVDTQLP